MVRIITDSSSLYTKKDAEQMGFDSVPLCVTIGNWNDRDLQMDTDRYYEMIKEGNNPTSSQPPIGDVIEVFEKYPDDEIINISMADGLSGTYQTACSAREIVDNKDNITVINTKTLCGPHRYMVEKAQAMKEAGCSAKEIINWVEMIREKSESFLIPQDFDFLRRGGRLTPVAAALGSVLKLKPVMTLTEDCMKLDKFAVKRTMKSAVDAVINHLKTRNLDSRHVLYISHADALEDAKKIYNQIKETFADLEIKIMDLSPVFVAQGGPQCVAIQYIER